MSKLVAERQKDFEFARALIIAGLIDIEILLARTALLPATVADRVTKAVKRAARQ